MDRRADPAAADADRLADRRGLRAAVAVCRTASARVVLQGSVLSAVLAAAVSNGGHASAHAAVSAAVRGDGRRQRADADTAARRKHHKGRHDFRHRTASRRTRFRGDRKHASAADARDASQKKPVRAVYPGRCAAENAYLPHDRTDRQRESFEGTGDGATRSADGSRAGPAAAAGAVCKCFQKRRSVRRTRAIGDPFGIRRCRRLRLRAVSAADRACGGNSAGSRTAGEMEDKT